MSKARAVRPAGLAALLALAATLLVQACTSREVVGVVVGSVSVSPPASSLVEGDTLRFTALVRDDQNATVEAPAVGWMVTPAGILSVDSAGLVQALLRGTATVRASFHGVTDSATVTVIAAPDVALGVGAVAFFGGAGGTAPAPRNVAVTNAGGGTLLNLTATVQYTAGQPTGWLTPSLGSTTGPTTLTLTPLTTGLAVGDYSATVTVASPNDRNAPVVLPVTLSLSGVVVVESGGSTSVAETGTTDSFTISLATQPASSVTLTVTSGDVSEATVAPSSVTFTAANWSTPQTVVVTGVDDLIADGTQTTTVTVAVDDAVSDDPFDALDDVLISVTTTDNDTPGITVGSISGPTSEAGGQATFTIRLASQPTTNVSIGLTSSDVTEGSVSPASVTFAAANWATPQTVTVTGVDDDIDDDNISYSVVTAPASSTDAAYNGLDGADVAVTNIDDADAVGIVVTPTSGLTTTEAGGQATFTVRLASQPTANVTIGLSSSDVTEGTVIPSSLTFTPANWIAQQNVTITSQDDAVADGNVAYTIATAPAVSADPKYNGLDAANVSVTNIDNEAAGFTVSQISGSTTEAGGQATFTIVLNNQPAANVTIGLTSSDTGEGTISSPTLTFTPANWDVAQTITVTGVNDDIDDGDVVYTIVTAPATSTDPNYSGVNLVDVLVTNVDDDTAGFLVSPPTGPTTETGGQAVFTVRLASQPSANVTIGLTSSDQTEGTVSPASLAFTSANWNVMQTVTVTGVNDALADGNITYQIVTAAATSTDPGYAGLNPADVTLTNVDDETAGITVSAAAGPTTESGGQTTFTAVLNTEPFATVTIGLSSSDLTEGTVSVASLTFTTANWNIPQTVTVTGVNDDVDDGDVLYTVVTAAATSSDPNYGGRNPVDVSATNIDDETAGFTVSAASGPTTEAGGQGSFTIRLNSQPTANVTVALTSSDLTEGTVSPASVTFTSASWNIPQTVTVTGVNDVTADGNIAYTIVTGAATSSDPAYSGLNPTDVSITNVDDETAGFTVSAASGPTTEAGGQATFTVVLNTLPTANVTIGLSSGDTGEGTISASSLVFTGANWNTPQTVTVTGVNDDVDDDNVVYSIVTAPATSSDLNYNGRNPADVSVTNVDDDTAGFAVSPTSGPTTEAGGQATFTVRLTSQPTANVAVGLSSNDLTEGTVAPASLTFTAANWSTTQTATVTGVDDALADGNVLYAIVAGAATSTDPKYSGLNPADVSVTNVDNETVGITVSAPSGPTTEVGGQATFTVVLNTLPMASVTIGLSSSNTAEGTISVSSLTFTTASWSTPQTVTVTGVNDAVDDGDIAYAIVTAAATSADPSYNGFNPADVSITNVDDDTAGLTVSAASGPTTEAGGQATFTVRLTSQPNANVSVGLSSSDLTEGTVSPASLTFTSANWSSPQTVTVTGVDDALADGNITYSIVTAAATSTDPRYSGLNPPDVSITNVDDETAGFTVSPASGPTTEFGGTATFTIVLNTLPTASVTVGLSSGDLTEGTVSPASVTFTTANWSTPQTVTVTGVNDDVDDDNVVYSIITAAASSTDPAYSGRNPVDVSVTNVDDDVAGFVVSPPSGPTTEGGGQATFSMRLTSQPTANVTVGLTSNDLTEGTVSPSSLTFTSANWATPQTVTATGVNDDLDDDNIVYSIVTAAATSTDPKYAAMNPADVSVTNVDDDASGFTISPPSGLTTEGGGQAVLTVRLTSQPSANVTVGLTSSDLTEGTVSPASLTFTPANWATPQAVTLTGVDDATVDGNVVYAVVTAPAASTDPRYSGLDPADVSVTNNDNDAVGFSVTAPAGPTTEAGGTTTFTIALTSQPTASVSIGLSSSDVTEGTVSPASVTFTTANWSTPQIVTVTGVNDDVDDDNIVFTIVTAPATSTDPSYGGADPADVSVTNVDDETAGFAITPATGPTTEPGGQATFTMRLTSQPLANVTVGITSSDTTEGTVAPASLLFTPANWSTPQTVTVTGVNDALADGNVLYSIVTAAAVSTDPKYGGLDPADVFLTNVDDEVLGITVSAATGPTTEAGGTATFTVVLNTLPMASVTVGISSSDLTEGTVSTSSLIFTTLNWNTPQTVTVTGVDDDVDDDNVAYPIVTAAATSTDATYNGFNPVDVSVTNVDDDTAGFTISAVSGPTTEDGGQATFTVRLASQPTADVTTGLSTSDATEGTVGPASLTFTAANWSTPQTVTITGANDAIDDDNVVYAIVTAPATSTDPKYSGMNPADVSVTNVDDLDLAGIVVTPTSGLVTTEAGGAAQFTVALNSQPVANVSVGISTADATEGTPSTPSLTFTNLNWSTPQVVTVNGINDAIDDDNVGYTIVTAAASSSDAKYTGMNPADVSVTNNDDGDTAGITVTPTSGLVTTEAGGTAQFTVVLTSEPVASVTIGLPSNDATEGTVSPSSVTFTNLNWNVPQVATITGVNDFVDDNDQGYTVLTAAATSTDAKYSGMNPADVSVTNTDDDTAGITVTPTSGLVTTEAGGTAQFTVVLTSEPVANVSVGVSSTDLTEGTVSPSSVMFTNVNWNVPQLVTATGVDDFVDDDNVAYTIVTAQATSTDPLYAAIDPANVSASNTDNDAAGILVSPTSGLVTTEAGGAAQFTIVLTSEPLANVSVGLSSNDLTEGTVGPASVTFTNLNWSTPQVVTVTGVGDFVDDGNVAYSIVTAQATSGDPPYAAINPSDVSVSNTDDDDAGITVTPTSGLVTTEAGGAAQFTIVLTSEPLANVTVGVSSNDLTEGTVSPASVTFTNVNWATPQTVTVTGANDAVDDGDIAYSVVTAQATSSDLLYAAINPANVSVTNNDDADTAGITVTPTSGLVTTEAGGTAQFTIVLTSEPVANVTVGVSSNDLTEGTVSPASVTLSSANWFTPQTVTVTGVNDAIDDGNVVYSIVTAQATSSDPLYAAINPANVSVTNNDDADTAGITVTPTSGLVTTEAGGTAQYTIVLLSEPVANVTVGVSSNDLTEGTASPASVTFTNVNWATPQTITVTGANDAIDDGNIAYSIVTAQATSSDPAYAAINPADVTVTNNDDADTAGITVTPTSGLVTTEAGGTAQFTIVLTSEPVANVTVGVSSNDTGEGTVSPSSVTFTSLNWSTPQTITITGVNDAVDDGNVGYSVVTAQATSGDPLYSVIDPADVTVTNNDDADAAGITVTPTSGLVTTEAGGTAQFTIVLTSEPVANVTVGVSSNDAGEGTVSPASLTFTSLNWNTPQTITVTGVNDAIDDGNVAYSIVTAQATSSDPLYAAINPSDVAVTNNDDADTAGFTVVQSGGSTTVNEPVGPGNTDDFTVVLTAQPTSDVVFTVVSGNTNEATVSPATLTFTSGDWNTPQTVDVFGVEDFVDDGDQITVVTISVSDAASDNLWDPLADQTVSVTTVDNDAVGFTIVQSGGTTVVSEGNPAPGTTDTFTIVLTSQPTSNVVFSIVSASTQEVIVQTPSLTFTPTGGTAWNIPQTVTVAGGGSGVDDGDTNTNVTVSIVDGSSDNAFDPLPDQIVVVTTIDIDPP